MIRNSRTENRAIRDAVHTAVRARFPDIVPMRDAWVTLTHLGWEFTGPGNFVVYLKADDCFHARAEGWEAWLAAQSPERNKGGTK